MACELGSEVPGVAEWVILRRPSSGVRPWCLSSALLVPLVMYLPVALLARTTASTRFFGAR